MKHFAIIISSGLLLASCGGQNTESKESSEQETKLELAQPSCSYAYVNENTAVEWTAYKTTDKVPVGGKFDEVKVITAKEAEDPMAILKQVSFEIPTSSTNTNLAERDEKIKSYFFGTLADTDMITGKVSSIDGNDKSGNAMVELSMNGLSKEVEASYSIDGTNISLETEFDVETWEGAAAIAALNKVCEDLHKGEDGISKLWSIVSVKVSTTLDKTCD